MTQAPLTVLIDTLRAEPTVWVRLAADKSAGEWVPRLLEVTTGEAPPGWLRRRWRYRDALFLATAPKGSTVAGWLSSRKIALPDARIPLPLHASATCERRESGWNGGGYSPLVWPHQEWRLTTTSTFHNPPASDVIGDGAPSFVSFDVATASLLGVPLTGWSISSREFSVRLQDRRARFDTVRLDAAGLSARVEGRGLSGTEIELAGEQPGPTRRLTRNVAREIRFPLPAGLPAGAWLLIRKGDDWLDRRYLAWPYARASVPGVEIAVEPATRLEALVAAGEGSGIEFKQHLPAVDETSRRKVMKTVAAFANGEGGTILFGVSNSGEIVGLPEEHANADVRDRLANIVRTWVFPLPPFEIESLPTPASDGRGVLALVVKPGEQPPYAAGTVPTNLVYYLRRGATSFAVMPNEIRALVLARSPSTSSPFGPG